MFSRRLQGKLSDSLNMTHVQILIDTIVSNSSRSSEGVYISFIIKKRYFSYNKYLMTLKCMIIINYLERVADENILGSKT